MCGVKKDDSQSRSDKCTGTWMEPNKPASAGQDGTAKQGRKAIQAAFASGKGGTYTVDPKTMRIEGALDVGKQIETSIKNGGAMKLFYDEAVSNGGTASFSFLNKAFNPSLIGAEGEAGKSVGRFSGDIRGTISVQSDGSWTVAGVVSIKSDQYNWNRDGRNLLHNALIGAGALTIGGGGKGKTITLEYNRSYFFDAWGSN